MVFRTIREKSLLIKVFFLIALLGAIAGFIGWAIHLGLGNSKTGFHTKTSQWPSMWASLFSFILASHAIWLLVRNESKYKESKQSVFVTIFYFVIVACLGNFNFSIISIIFFNFFSIFS